MSKRSRNTIFVTRALSHLTTIHFPAHRSWLVATPKTGKASVVIAGGRHPRDNRLPHNAPVRFIFARLFRSPRCAAFWGVRLRVQPFVTCGLLRRRVLPRPRLKYSLENRYRQAMRQALPGRRNLRSRSHLPDAT